MSGEKPPRYYLSPVDYEAWGKGYLPPSDHLLIHALMFSGAHVISSSSITKDEEWWFVVRGRRPSQKALMALWKMLAEDEVEREAIDDGDAKLSSTLDTDEDRKMDPSLLSGQVERREP